MKTQVFVYMYLSLSLEYAWQEEHSKSLQKD